MNKVLTSKDIDSITDVNILGEIVADHTQNIKIRMNCLFQLRTIGSLDAIKALENALLKEPSSDLLRHEICYAFGQMIKEEGNREEIEKFINNEIFDKSEKWASIVLHEAAEALGNISNENNIKLLEKFVNYDDEIIKETCELAIENLKWLNNTNNGVLEGFDEGNKYYCTNDPAPPFNFDKEPKYKDVSLLKKILVEGSTFEKNRVLFTLRNLGTEDAINVLCSCFNENFTALLKHEVSFILGQMAEIASTALSKLEEVLQDETQDPIVRHETALALGEISKGKELLQKYSTHSNQLIAESCIIAEEFVDYWKEMHQDCC